MTTKKIESIKLLLLNKRIKFFWFLMALFTFLPVAFSQTTTVYPGSTIVFYSSRDAGVNTSGCPQGGQASAFHRVLNANGWLYSPLLISEIKSGVGSQEESNSKKIQYTTVHPDSKRIRHWTVISNMTISRSSTTTRTQCDLSAKLEGDSVDDSLEVDIGVLISDKLNKGEQVSPIKVAQPIW